jgi:hypothetical protein
MAAPRCSVYVPTAAGSLDSGGGRRIAAQGDRGCRFLSMAAKRSLPLCTIMLKT